MNVGRVFLNCGECCRNLLADACDVWNFFTYDEMEEEEEEIVY
jgi:hypothetical protein